MLIINDLFATVWHSLRRYIQQIEESQLTDLLKINEEQPSVLRDLSLQHENRSAQLG